ncbi:MAG: hypothetical protein OM95_06495 [Bdellovibrio sp. ArHS]|uniref:hypothetical protein n=1 Tax=Bdellovibrio sp. ArHS TaxID=1569284 RepID=UPI000583BF10|nr:hypothetical protein [Bdellovibrio sp. ArHS]KHD88775.1 MAG: hypothetical protein OM95_06495 [Bdellovibrio sp. ArHS]
MKILGVVLILLLTLPTQAKRKTEWSLHIDTKLDAVYFAQEYGSETNQDLYKLELDPIYDWRYLDNVRFFVKPTFIANPNNKSETEKYFFDPGEAFLRYQTETSSLQAGYNLFTWGVTDGYNPLDVVNSKQYFDPLHSRKMGTPSVVWSQNFDNWDYELVYIPTRQGAVLPGEQSRWLPREIFVPQTPENDLLLLLPERLNYSYGSKDELDDALKNNYAFRIQRRGNTFDFGLSYFEGVAAFPLIQPVVTGTIVSVSPKTVVRVDPDVTLNVTNYRIRQGGVTMVANSWDTLFKLASSYTSSITESPYLQKWTFENVMGLEKTFTFGESGLLIAVLQKSFITTEKENDSNLSTTEIFRDAWMIGGRLSWKEVWNFSLLGLYDGLHGSNYEELTLTRRFWDAWNLSLTASLIQGSSETPLGVYEKNDSYTLTLSRSF